ncbi:MAG: filamentous hemagglutinin N-terminal domain-containing protein, partial [Pseudomonadota bacterium]
MPTSKPAASHHRRAPLMGRTALCGALFGLAVLSPGAALALPVGGIAQVNPGGGLPQISQTQTRVDVTLNAPRTALTWTTFNVKPDETVSFNFADRNWIVLNRVTGLTPSKIEGVVEGRVGGAYGGNVWFTSQSSIIFGPGARIDAGGILAANGVPDLGAFLDPANTLFSFSGSDNLPDAKVMVLADAGVTAHGGMVALMGPSIVTRTNAVVTASEGSTLYGSARTFQIRMAPGTGGDFDLVDFIVPTASDGSEARVAIDLGGTTSANAVFLAAVSRSAIGGAIVNLEGMVTAQAAKVDGGDIILSGGGGIQDRQAGPRLADAAPTDIYLNRASASRDLHIDNVGRIFARPWVRPLEDAKDPNTLAEDQAFEEFCEQNPFNVECGSNGAPLEPLETVDLDGDQIASLFDPTAISAISTGRDARIAATASIELGRIVAARDVTVVGPDIKANSLIANRDLSAASTTGDIRLASVGVMGAGVVTGHTDVAIDAITAPQGLTVSSGRDVTIGDGVSNVSGAVTVEAPRNVLLDMGGGRVETVTAGGSVNLRGAAVEVGTITAPILYGEAASIRIDNATIGGDLYVVATSGDASVGSATVGDDVYVIATHGTASLADANLTGLGADSIGVQFAGNPDSAGNGRVAHVQSTDFDARLGLGTGGVTGATAVRGGGGGGG